MQERAAQQIRLCARRTAKVSVSGVRASTSRATTSEWLYGRAQGGNSASNARAVQSTRHPANVRCQSTDTECLDEKKVEELPHLETTLVDPELPQKVLELDELWSFVFKKSQKIWVWIALCATTRQVVAFVTGDRSEKSCQKLWDEIPQSYKSAHLYSDFWKAYQVVLPSELHEAVGKESGKTNHVERWNNTLRQRLAQFVRKTLSFSKCVNMHFVRLKLFIHRYNRERACAILP